MSCLHRKKSGLKNIYLRIKREDELELSTPPNFTESDAKRFLREKEGWIERKASHLKEFCRSNPKSYYAGCSLWFLGRRYSVELKRAKRSSLSLESDRFIYAACESSKFYDIVEKFYKKSAAEIVLKRVSYWSDKMNLFPKEVRFRRYKSRWGCCSKDDVITLNTALLRYDLKLIDYVIIHELAHIRYKNHKKEFWNLVGKFEPEYKSLRERLV
ncbi:MAG: M48 family metallopeptidase [Hydrogenimonas sp.]|nr:M48 family metallopeptidase [Hydrogenimonas sp.]